MDLKEENHSKLFQPTFGWHSTRGTVHTRAQLPAQESSLPCEKHHFGNSPSATQQQLTPTCILKSWETATASSLLAEGMVLGTHHTSSFVSLQAPQFPTSVLARVQGQAMPSYHQCTTCESKQKHGNFVQLRDSMNGYWKDSQAQL